MKMSDRRALDDEFSLFEVGAILLRHRRKIAGAALLGTVAMAGLTLLSTPSYTSQAAFMPQSGGGQASRLAGMAAQFGFQLPSSEIGRSPTFYADFLRSRATLEKVAGEQYSIPASEAGGESRTGTLVELYEVGGATEGIRLSRAVDRLKDAVNVQVRADAGVVDLRVTSRWPSLAWQVASALLDAVHAFNVEVRRVQAGEERGFLENRVDQAQEELLAAEDSLETFLQRNRAYQNSPTLRFEYQRLQRRVDLEQQVFSSLAQSLEEAKIEEVRNTPVVTIVAEPARPAVPDRRWLLAKTALGGLLGLLLGIAWAYGRSVLEMLREDESDDYREWRRLRQETAEDVRRLAQWIRHRLPFTEA